MKKLLNKPWFAAVLALAALTFVGNAVYQGTRKPAYGSGAPASATTAAAEGEATAEGETVRLPVRDALKALVLPKTVLRDPFAPRAREEVAIASAEKATVPDLVDTVHLSALWTQSGATYTLINDRICQAGDKIGRMKIESATQEGVWVSHWKGRDFISLGGDFTLKTPAIVSTL
jgi:hypothetical protein